MFTTPGNFNPANQVLGGDVMETMPMQIAAQQAMVVDENYMMIGGHIEEIVKKKIINYEYVDFSHLLPRDRLSREEDN